MKVFLSLPMHGYSRESIIDEMLMMETAVEKLYDVKDVEFVMNFNCVPKKGVRHARPYCLASAIEKIADCDLVVFHPNYRQANGCLIEYEVCDRYHINAYVLDEEDMNI